MNSISLVLRNWNLDPSTVTPIDTPSHTAWDVDGLYVLKQYRKPEEALRSIQISKLLHAEDILVSTYIPGKNGNLSSPDGLYCLMNKLPGKHIDFYEEPQTVSVIGAELAKLHRALAAIEPRVTCHDSNLLTEWREKYEPSVHDLLPASVIEVIGLKLEAAYPKLPRQLIHRDVHPHNVLFDCGKLTGWLDFDIGQKNVRLFDLAYLLSGLLVGNIHDPGKIKVWHTIYYNLLAGYDKVSHLTRDEHDMLPVLMIVIECLFCWWNQKQNNSEQHGISLAVSEWLCEEFFCVKGDS